MLDFQQPWCPQKNWVCWIESVTLGLRRRRNNRPSGNTVQFSFNRDAEQCWAGTHFAQLLIDFAPHCVAERVGSETSPSLNGIGPNRSTEVVSPIWNWCENWIDPLRNGPQYLFHFATLGEFVDQLIQVSGFLRERVLDFLNAVAANGPRDQVGVGI